MNTNELNYDLPQDLIAQHPVPQRSASKLLVLNRKQNTLCDHKFNELEQFLRPGDCLVLNNTRVLPARFYAKRQSGAHLEGLFLNAADQTNWRVLLKGLRKLKDNETFYLLSKDGNSTFTAKLLERYSEGQCQIQVESQTSYEQTLEDIGFPPLPPYIKRDTDLTTATADKEHYQTVFARHAGAVAAPTAGLHFSKDMLKKLKDQGIHTAELTLHVGIGTFKPVTAKNLADHPIHSEYVSINQESADKINQLKQKGARIIAVGTTSVRAMESAAVGKGSNARLQAFADQTRLFITPGYQFKLVDALITNFHLPKSTLIALVGAFAGLDTIMNAYQYAIKHKYRFYSYGDAMLII